METKIKLSVEAVVEAIERNGDRPQQIGPVVFRDVQDCEAIGSEVLRRLIEMYPSRHMEDRSTPDKVLIFF